MEPAEQAKIPLSGRDSARRVCKENEGRWEADLAKWREPLSAFWGAYIAQPLPVSGFTFRVSRPAVSSANVSGPFQDFLLEIGPRWGTERLLRRGSPFTFLGLLETLFFID